jgi:hypothetical protein
MQRDQPIQIIIERLRACSDENLLDFILALLIEGSY